MSPSTSGILPSSPRFASCRGEDDKGPCQNLRPNNKTSNKAAANPPQAEPMATAGKRCHDPMPTTERPKVRNMFGTSPPNISEPTNVMAT
eukprot:CAMPEP_0177563228 /NCGR_PEP_ID=MMETSP0369-20130122/72949_1 /TAXON_ID=447022 ORGANISM="Scrippsiella hangoei-like, Strain SHHI-4" /NCGR_SAMPLE_ID=MMETSP0369 /ASSEMBLY_ACC=CAM_ASM_000364 /LENGTH=89 /DNA_ID=CAMNT_0019050393 /DNA_START=311 /DNA_END=580 /DNA_ORIENTATION=-